MYLDAIVDEAIHAFQLNIDLFTDIEKAIGEMEPEPPSRKLLDVAEQAFSVIRDHAFLAAAVSGVAITLWIAVSKARSS